MFLRDKEKSTLKFVTEKFSCAAPIKFNTKNAPIVDSFTPSSIKTDTIQTYDTFSVNNSISPEVVRFFSLPETMGINKVHEMGYTGKGVVVAVIDSGITSHPDLKNNLILFKDFSCENLENEPKFFDPLGHGTYVTGIIAGNGISSRGKFKGIAPDANIIALRVSDEKGEESGIKQSIEAMDWVLKNKDKYNIRIVNMSLGVNALKSWKEDEFAAKANELANNNIVVVVSAGNEGVKGEGSISSPGIAPNVITVGYYDNNGSLNMQDDTIPSSSSMGKTLIDNLAKPDLIAPGVNITSVLAENSRLARENFNRILNSFYFISPMGASIAVPVISGVVACMLQANPYLTSSQVKNILKLTANPIIGESPKRQGRGRVDPIEAVSWACQERNKMLIVPEEEIIDSKEY